MVHVIRIISHAETETNNNTRQSITKALSTNPPEIGMSLLTIGLSLLMG
jgi:hypothetical protein